jgi:hypothetical protein
VKILTSLFYVLLINTTYANTTVSNIKEDSETTTFMTVKLNLTASQNINQEINNFKSQDLNVINEEFERSLNRPIVAIANARIDYRHNNYSFKYHRDYFTLLELQNPVFPRLRITQFNDHKFAYGHIFSRQKLTAYFETQYIQRRYQMKVYELNDILDNRVQFDPEVGKSFNFYRLNTKINYQLQRNNSLFLHAINLDTPTNPIKESSFKIGNLRRDSFGRYLWLNSSFNISRFPTWESFIEVEFRYISLKLTTNSFRDINKELKLQYKNLKLSYINKTFRDYKWKKQSSPLEGVSLSYTYTHF